MRRFKIDKIVYRLKRSSMKKNNEIRPRLTDPVVMFLYRKLVVLLQAKHRLLTDTYQLI